MRLDCIWAPTSDPIVEKHMKQNKQKNYVGMSLCYGDLMKLVETQAISLENLNIRDDDNNLWSYDKYANGFVNDNHVFEDYYEDYEYNNFKVTIVSEKTQAITSEYRAKKVIIKHIEDMYADLQMELDNCQGCTDNLSDKFAILHIYKDLVTYLGGNLDKDKEDMFNRWYAKRKDEEKEKQRQELLKEFRPYKLPVDLLIEDTVTSKAVFDLGIMFNELVSKLNAKNL